MENLLSNQEFNALAKDIKLEHHDFKAAVISDTPISIEELLGKFKVYWKVIKPILKVAKLITPPKIDKGIDEFITIVDRLLHEQMEELEQSKLLEKFAIIWGIIKPILEKAKDFTGPKVDAIIDEVIKIGDWLAKS